MLTARIASVAAVLGGLVWIIAAAIDWGQDVNPVVYLVGLVWFVVAFAALGYTLVDHAPVWLRAIVSVATPALAYMVWIAAVDAFDTDALPVLVAGLLLLVGGGVGFVRSRPEPSEAPVRGHRAAR